MITPMKNLLILPIIFVSVFAGYSQNVSLQSTLKSHNYANADHQSGIRYYQVGYQFNDSWSVELEYGSSTASYAIRMPNREPTPSNIITALFSALFSLGPENLRVDKFYSRKMYSYRAKINYYMSPSFKVYVGPAIRYNTVTTKSTNEATYNGTLFSDLEFDDHSNVGAVAGLDYIYSFSDWFYLTLGVDIQMDIHSSSSKIADSRFIGSSASFGIGAGIRIGVTNPENEIPMEEL